MSDSPVIEYRGNCHCGAFKFTFKAPALTQAFACNCSICSKNGYLWAFPASNEDFQVVKGSEDATLKTYEFGKHTMAHKFCPTCGTSVLARMHKPVNGQSLAINIRAFMDVDLWSLPVLTSDGAATEPQYKTAAPMDVGPVPDGTTVYNGSCHCGAVGYAVLAEEKISKALDCDCSICSRDGALWIYPPTTKVTFKGLESLTEYTFASRTVFHGFCKVCGVAIRERFEEPGRVDVALNVRTIDGLDLSAVELEKDDGKGILPPYEV